MLRNAAVVGAIVLAGAATVAIAKKDGPEPSVQYAKTWDAAVAEAKELNVPIVVHSHGFY